MGNGSSLLIATPRLGKGLIIGIGLSPKKTSELIFIVNLLLCLVKVYPCPFTVYCMHTYMHTFNTSYVYSITITQVQFIVYNIPQH